MRTQGFEETIEANRTAAASATASNRAWARTRLAASSASTLASLTRLLAGAPNGTRSVILAQAAELVGRAVAADRVGIYLAPGPLSLASPPEVDFVLAASWARRGLGFRGEAALRTAGAVGGADPTASLDVVALERLLATRVIPCATPKGVVALITLDGPPLAQEALTATLESSLATLITGFLERDRLERELEEARAREARSERLAQLGRIACSSAHDLCNVLTAIVGYADLLELELAQALGRATASGGLPGSEELAEIRTAAARGAVLVEEVLGFGRGPAVEEQEEDRGVDLADALRRIAGPLRRLAGDPIALDISLAKDLPPARIDAERLGRVMMNLVANARHAIEARTGSTAGSRTAACGSGRIAIDLRRGDGVSAAGVPMLRLAVRDDGCGMRRELVRRVTEPFFTTRAADGGTGLGLADAAEFARRAGGRLVVESAEGLGTEIALLLPAAR